MPCSYIYPTLPDRDPSHRAAMIWHGSPSVVPLRDDFMRVPPHQSQGWTIFGHPGNKRYAFTKAQAITVVTEAPIVEPGVSDHLNACIDTICNIIAKRQIHIPENSDLFLEICQDSNTCNYYFVDHIRRTIFWPHTLDTTGIGHPQLSYALEENYWVHVKQYPESAIQYSAAALNDLQGLLLDHHTEPPSFPYTAKQREALVDLLERSKDHASSPHIITYVAGLWATICCQLASNQSILKTPHGKWDLVLEIISRTMLLDLPNLYRARFQSFWLDQFVNTSRWRKHVSRTVEHLKQTMSWLAALLILNGVMIRTSTFTVFIKSSSLFCVVGLAEGSLLLWEQQRIIGANAATAAMHLDDQNTFYSLQSTACLRSNAVAHSLPQASFAWALLLLTIQGTLLALSDLPVPLILPASFSVIAVLVIAFVGIRKAVFPCQNVFKDPVTPAPLL